MIPTQNSALGTSSNQRTLSTLEQDSYVESVPASEHESLKSRECTTSSRIPLPLLEHQHWILDRPWTSRNFRVGCSSHGKQSAFISRISCVSHEQLILFLGSAVKGLEETVSWKCRYIDSSRRTWLTLSHRNRLSVQPVLHYQCPAG